MATLRDAEAARETSAESLRQLGAHAIAVEETADERQSKKSPPGHRTTRPKTSYSVVAYFDGEPPSSMPENVEIQSGAHKRLVPVEARRSAKFKIEAGPESGEAQLE